MTEPEIYKNAGILVCNIIIVFILFRRDREKKILLPEFIVYGAGIAELGFVIIQGIQVNGTKSILLAVIQLLLAENMALLFVLWEKLNRIKSRKRDMEDTSIYLISLFLLFWLTLENWTEKSIWLALVKQLCCLAVYGILRYLRRRQQLQQDRTRLEEETGRQHQKETDYMQTVDRQYQRTRELWHDLKNHIGVLKILVQEQKYTELSEYLTSFQQDVENRMIPTKTGNAAVDALLSDKFYRARRADITVTWRLCDLSELAVNAIDLCVILGNLLDNAIEACEKLDGEKRIQLQIKYQDEFYYLSIINTAAFTGQMPARDAGNTGKEAVGTEGTDRHRQSSKRDMENGVGHGLGLRSVERIAHQYCGSMVTDYAEGQFKVIVRLKAE